MSRNLSGVYTLPVVYEATPGDTILATQHNTPLEDIQEDLNTPRPIVAGGTGVDTAIEAWDAFAAKGNDIATASTLVLSTATGPLIELTGTTTVTAVTLLERQMRICRAAAAFKLTAGVSLVVNGSTTASYTTKAGDLLLFEGYASSVVHVWTIANGKASETPGILTKSSGFTVDDTYRGKTVVVTSGSLTVALTAAATLGDGFWFDFRNEGTGKVVIDPNSTETINGQTTLSMYKNGGRVICDGSNWRIIGLSQREAISTTGLISGVASVDYSSLDLSSYSEVTLHAIGVLHATNATAPYIRLSLDGTTWVQGAGDYSHQTWRFTASASGAGGSTANTVFALIDSEVASSSQVFSFRFTMQDPGATNPIKDGFWEIEGLWSSGSRVAGKGSGRFLNSANAIQGIQYLPASGNVSGFFYLDAIRKVF